MRHYENFVIVKPTLTEEEMSAAISSIEEIITSNGGEIVATSPLGIKKLAYPIEKNERGFMHVIYYKNEPSSILEIERRFRINEDLLRFVTIKYDSKREVKAWENLVANTAKSKNVAEETPKAVEPEPVTPSAEAEPTATQSAE